MRWSALKWLRSHLPKLAWPEQKGWECFLELEKPLPNHDRSHWSPHGADFLLTRSRCSPAPGYRSRRFHLGFLLPAVAAVFPGPPHHAALPPAYHQHPTGPPPPTHTP